MPIPKYDEIRPIALKLLAERGTLHKREFTEPLADQFGLTEQERREIYPSGNEEVFADRISWALSYLNLSGLVEKPKRGYYRISDQGKALLATPDKINPYIDEKMAEREAARRKTAVPSTEEQLTIEESTSSDTPQEKLYKSFENIRKTAYDEILNTILSKTPTAFERLVVQLLQRMGYGGEVEGAGIVTSPGNDGGIDGVIKEDVLGLGRIYIQAKRYDLKNGVSRPDLDRFGGALALRQPCKGVFITTSYFSEGALEYARRLPATITLVLIDGRKLAEYIYDYGLGMQVEQTLELKRLDADFWDAMPDDAKS
jgi:restriction system protein